MYIKNSINNDILINKGNNASTDTHDRALVCGDCLNLEFSVVTVWFRVPRYDVGWVFTENLNILSQPGHCGLYRRAP